MEEISRSPMPGGTKTGLRIPTWLLGILVASGLTFVGGFYYPEQDANAVLTRDLKHLGAEYERSLAAYQKSHVELTALEKIRDEQAGALGAISEQKQGAEKELAALYQAISNPLEKFVKAKALTVEKRESDVVVSLQSNYLVYPHKTFVHDRGKQLLCEIAKALPKTVDEPMQVVAHVNGDEPSSGPLKKEFPSSFQLSSSVAADVTLNLAACGVSADGLQAVGAGHAHGDPTLAKKSVARIDIVVSPKKSR